MSAERDPTCAHRTRRPEAPTRTTEMCKCTYFVSYAAAAKYSEPRHAKHFSRCLWGVIAAIVAGCWAVAASGEDVLPC